MQRKLTKSVKIGQVTVGGGAPVSVQSMCNTPTADVAATLAQLRRLAAAGADIGRVAVPDDEAAAALPRLVRESPLPLVADIHFDHRLALAAIAAGVAGLRINPGNIGGPQRVAEVAAAARAAGVPIRVGVNGGSLPRDIREREGGVTAGGLCEAALRQAELLEDNGFSSIKLSLKASSLPVMLAAYRQASALCDYPLHIGVTEAGTLSTGALKSALGVGALLSEGIGDTLRVSLTADPVQEVLLGQRILQLLEMRAGGVELIACPTCGRTRIDVIGIAEAVEARLAQLPPSARRLKVAVMGCAVNGPGEAADADIGVAGGDGRGLLFAHGRIIGSYDEDELLEALWEKVNEILQK
ncbi:MAG: flavodoxin-dependent (E)-4-hydroxy-3-methylbut-2-enyl-diphosphate synthase [Bacillota bacterium]|nr:flavodoxin-dependent (E)-4-hydroxy-3-methylbut-2-enyl-diphosphate synthase [Bacillota bacterium]